MTRPLLQKKSWFLWFAVQFFWSLTSDIVSRLLVATASPGLSKPLSTREDELVSFCSLGTEFCVYFRTRDFSTRDRFLPVPLHIPFKHPYYDPRKFLGDVWERSPTDCAVPT